MLEMRGCAYSREYYIKIPPAQPAIPHPLLASLGDHEDIVGLLDRRVISIWNLFLALVWVSTYMCFARAISREHIVSSILRQSHSSFLGPHIVHSKLARTILSTGALQSAQSSKAAQVSLVASSAMYVTSNLIADIIFYWNRRLTIILLPALLVSVAAGFGYTSVILLIHFFFSEKTLTAEDIHLNTVGTDAFIASLSISVFTTSLLTGLTVGRIWVLARLSRLSMRRGAAGTYYTVSAMILESGALYCVFGIAFVVVGFKVAIDGFSTGAVFGQIVCMAPTLIAVRVGLGRSVEDVNSFAVISRTSQRYDSANIGRSTSGSHGRVIDILTTPSTTRNQPYE
ncbi:hypothetical protein B0H16DRAFT_1757846 [Mycena metata]|uniref:Uncharacterized protein n=1 Tax=Mycena metata TaxID=1033252 RepID=A0AAD7N0T3_9AGAR|nr:hypothetical protein B0H16DRAFT_1757846 [Mycena metata]